MDRLFDLARTYLPQTAAPESDLAFSGSQVSGAGMGVCGAYRGAVRGVSRVRCSAHSGRSGAALQTSALCQRPTLGMQNEQPSP